MTYGSFGENVHTRTKPSPSIIWEDRNDRIPFFFLSSTALTRSREPAHLKIRTTYTCYTERTMAGGIVYRFFWPLFSYPPTHTHTHSMTGTVVPTTLTWFDADVRLVRDEFARFPSLLNNARMHAMQPSRHQHPKRVQRPLVDWSRCMSLLNKYKKGLLVGATDDFRRTTHQIFQRKKKKAMSRPVGHRQIAT